MHLSNDSIQKHFDRTRSEHPGREATMKLFPRIAALLAVLGIAAVSVPAVAQDAESAVEDARPTTESELDAYWADRRRPRVLQRRLYPTDGEVQLTLFFGAIPNEPAMRYFPVGLRAGYWLSENIGLELSGEYIGETFRSESDLGTFLQDNYNADFFLRDEQLWRANLTFLYSPIYGKFSFSGTKLAHFDWYFGAGMGVAGIRNPLENNLAVTETEIKPEAVLRTGWNLHLHQNWALRIDYNQYIFEKASGGVTLPSEISLGASYFF